jgi:cytochrome c oxidase cbb3-type subunit 1
MIILNSIKSLLGVKLFVLGQQAASLNSPFFILLILLIAVGLILLLISALILKSKLISILKNRYQIKSHANEDTIKTHISTFSRKQLNQYLSYWEKIQRNNKLQRPISIIILSLLSQPIFAQNEEITDSSLMTNGGMIITFILIMIPVILIIAFMIIKIRKSVSSLSNKQKQMEAEKLAQYLRSLPEEDIEEKIKRRKEALDFELENNELSGENVVRDDKGLISVNPDKSLPFVAVKKKADRRPPIDSKLSNLVLWFTFTATFWLVFGTSVGEYVGIKFIAPDIDQTSWLSFGRLRPVHTNSVFWGWASLGMLALGYYAVPRVGNNKLFSYRIGWISLILINITVFCGTIALMAGINNGGGEFREYIWPIQLPFAIALVLTLYNFLKTIAQRKTHEIYISNWYMVAALIFGITITIVAYVPWWQNGLGETIIQGYYMHQGVGMWFMMFTLGIVYYYLPQQLNRPIYSYSLGILAFWTQILFYTLIGTHHFVFSSIPWWLQTVAIVGSVGMIIPVVAGTTNFIMTFKGAWHKVTDSYTLPFFLVGIIFYFTGSMQGTAEAFRETNLIWHFTDFTVAHSHLTMYGIICFFLWAGMYAIIPRLTGKEPPQITVGAHFWFALIGLLFYSVPLMYGGTLRGLSWMQGNPFMDSVTLMAPHWLWRAIGGSLMWISHLFFAYNLYKMWVSTDEMDIRELALQELEKDNGPQGS